MSKIPEISNFIPSALNVSSWRPPTSGAHQFPLSVVGVGTKWTAAGFKFRRLTSSADNFLQITFRYTVDGVTWLTAGGASEIPSPPVGTWHTFAPFFTSTIPVGAVAVAVRLTAAASVPSDYEVDGTEASVTNGESLFPLRLEVEREPEAGELVNEIENPSGDLGASGWITTVPGAVLVSTNDAYTHYRQGLKLTTGSTGGSGNYLDSERFTITPGQWARAQWHVNYTPYNRYRANIIWLNSGGTYVGEAGWTTFTASYADHSIVAAQAPAGTAKAYLVYEVGGSGGSYPYVYGGSHFSVRDVVVAKAATSGELADLSGTVPVRYTDILGPTHEIHTEREDLNLGVLNATVLDSALDPATATTLRPGRRVRLMAFNTDSSEFEPLFFGESRTLEVEYEEKDYTKPPRITLSAVDNVQALAGSRRPQGVAKIKDLPYVLEGAGVPWNVNGSGQQVASATVVSVNDNATAMDQVAITRDSALGYAWVDRFGVVQAWSSLPDPDVELIPNGTFEASTAGWTTQYVGGVAGFGRVGSGDPAHGWIYRFTANAAANTTQMRIELNPRVAVVPGTKYAVSAAVYNNTTARKCPVWIDWWDEAGAYMSTSGDDYNAGSQSGTVGAWKTITHEVVAPVGAATAMVCVAVGDTSVSMAASEIHYVDDITMKALSPVVVLDESRYSGLDLSFSTDECINSVSIKYLRYDSALGKTEEIFYGPYEDLTSIEDWGIHSAEFTVHGGTESSVAMENFADAVLARNATPAIRPNSVVLPIKSTSYLSSTGAFVDLYDLVDVVNAAKSVDKRLRATGIEHEIVPGKWLTTVTFADMGSVASPQLTPPVQTTGPEPILMQMDKYENSYNMVPFGGMPPNSVRYNPAAWTLSVPAGARTAFIQLQADATAPSGVAASTWWLGVNVDGAGNIDRATEYHHNNGQFTVPLGANLMAEVSVSEASSITVSLFGAADAGGNTVVTYRANVRVMWRGMVA